MQHQGHCEGIQWSRHSFSGSRPGRARPCGHFRRIRYGEGLAESRLGWIQPVLVNAGELTAAGSSAVKTKPYVVR